MKWQSRYQRLRNPCQVKGQRNDVFAVTLSKALLITDLPGTLLSFISEFQKPSLSK